MADQLTCHDSILAKIDALCSIVQSHSDSFEHMRKSTTESFNILCSSLAAQQTVMAKMMVKIQQLDRAASSHTSPQPRLLPFPPSTAGPLIHHSPPPGHHSPLTPPSLHSTVSVPSSKN